MTTAAEREAIETLAAEYGVSIEYKAHAHWYVAGGIASSADSSRGILTLGVDPESTNVAHECHELAHAVCGIYDESEGFESSDLRFCRIERRARLATQGLEGVVDAIQAHIGEQEAVGPGDTLAYHQALLARVERHLARRTPVKMAA